MVCLREQSAGRRTFALVLTLIAQSALVSSALAIDYVSVSAGNYALTTNWSPVGLPGTADNVLILHAMTTTAANSAHDMVIDSGGSLTTGATFNISGDLSVTGTGAANFTGASLTFNGSGLQTVDGAMTFNNIAISNTAPTPSDTDCVIFNDPVALPGGLSLIDGQAIFADGTSLRAATVNANGIFKHAAGATITVTGAPGLTLFTAATVGTYVHNGGTLVFAGPDAQQVNVSDEFFNVTVANTDPTLGAGNGVSFIGADTVTGLFRVQDGEAYNSFAQMTDVQIDADGLLAGTNLSVSGDFHQSGTFSPSTTGTTFNGSGPQTISGNATFFGLLISNTAAAPSDVNCVSTTGPITALGALTVADGQFTPADGSAFRDVGIGGNGILKPVAASEFAVTGANGTIAWSQSGTFDSNAGSVAFTGNARQIINPSVAASFHDIRVANTSATPSTTSDVSIANSFTTSSGTITVEDGMFTARNQHNNIQIEADGLLNLSGITSFSGNFAKNAAAAFTTNAQGVSFNGNGPQTITGGTGFAALTIANSAATPGDAAAVVANGPVTAAGQLLVNDGQFMPDEGSAFRDVNIGAAGILKPVAGTEFTLTGANGVTTWAQTGSFVSNGGSVAFTGSTLQTVNPSVAMSFHDLRIANTAATPSVGSDVSVPSAFATSTGTVTVEDGMLTVRSQHNDLVVEADGLLNLFGNLSLSGDLTKHPAAPFTTNGAAVSFNGSGPQVISGPMTFATLQINNTSATPNDSNAVTATDPVTSTGPLQVNDGLFLSPDGSIFSSVAIGAAGELRPENPGDSFTLIGGTGAIWVDSGLFTHNDGNVVVDTPGAVSMSGSTTFHDLTFIDTIGGANSLAGAVGMAIEGLFDIQDGTVSQWADVHDVQIGAGGSWVNGPTAATVRGDIDNAGALDLSLGGVSFDAGGPASIQSSTAAQLGDVVVATGTLLSETGAADNFTATGLTIDGTLRRERSVVSPGVITGGLTGASLEFTNIGTVGTLFIDRFGSVPNAAAEHTEAASWEFNPNGGTGFTTHLTLPHALVVPSQATVSRYLGTGTNWDFVQDAFTPTSVTRNGIIDLTSRWAVGDSLSAVVGDWSAM